MDFDLEQIKIQPMTPEYYERNLDLINIVIKENHFLARETSLTWDDNLKFIKTYFGLQNTTYLIALDDEKVIGHMVSLPRFEDLLSHVVSIGYIVHPEYREKGICSKLMESLNSVIKKKENIKLIYAEVANDNLASKKLLLKFGFNEYGRLPRGIMTKNKIFIDLIYYYKSLFVE